MNHAIGRDALALGGYAVAIAWLVRAVAAARHVPRLPNLLQSEWDASPASSPSICIVVPARNESANISATLQSLLQQDYSNLQVIAVNDRSEDDTGAIIDDLEAQYAGRLRALHITHLPVGWLGKTHAMHAAVDATESKYLLFTDADVLFSASIIRRVLVYAERTGAEHVVVAPTPEVRTVGEGALLGFLQVLGLWASRPWRVADPRAKRDFIGIGAFNLVRREVFERLGGWQQQRLAVVEDVTLGRRLKQAGVAQRFVLAAGTVRVHWAPGLGGIVRVMTKNLFAVLFYQPFFVLTSASFIALMFLAPLAGLFARVTILPALICLGCIALCHQTMRSVTNVQARFFWLFPVGALAFLYAMVRSMLVVLKNGGVEWRGTHYSLTELRANNRFSVRS